MKNILLVPTIINKYNENYLSVDKNWLIFLKKIYGKFDLQIAPFINKKPNLIIILGGNDLIKKNSNKADLYRNNLNKKFLNYAIKNNIKTIGICLGAQFIASTYYSKLVKVRNHVGIHKIFFDKKFIKKRFPKFDSVNSFHNYGISRLGKNLMALAKASDKSIEFFIHKKRKIIGIMWHPERFKKLKKLDKKIFKYNLWN
jgi:N5-(cytidine 5'-diphosphoramidyl)-L-glutamine hydrolase